MRQANITKVKHHHGIFVHATEHAKMILYNTTSAKIIRDLKTLNSVFLLYGHSIQFRPERSWYMLQDTSVASQTHCPQVQSKTTAKQTQTHLHHTCPRRLSSSPSRSSARVDRASSYPSSVSWDRGYSSPGDRETQ